MLTLSAKRSYILAEKAAFGKGFLASLVPVAQI